MAAASNVPESGAYHDSNEVDRTTLEGHVTKEGEKISEFHTAVRGELIDCATVESDVTEDVWQQEYRKAYGCSPPVEKLYDDETQAMAGWYDGEIDREAELAKAKSQGWIGGDKATPLARSEAGGADEDNSVQVLHTDQTESKCDLCLFKTFCCDAHSRIKFMLFQHSFLVATIAGEISSRQGEDAKSRPHQHNS